MTEKNVILDEFNTKKMIKKLEKLNALCPSCERRLKRGGALFIYTNTDNNKNYFYIICRKCEYKKEKQTVEKIENIKSLIETRLKNNEYPYTCEEVDDPNIENILNNVVRGSEKLQINALTETLGAWHKHDQEFFKENPSRKFYARKVYPGELDVTNSDNEFLKNDAAQKGISYSIVHLVGEGQRVYSYVSDLTGHPFEEEDFVAALFMVKVNNMFTPDDIYELYEKIKENKSIVDDFKLNKFTT